MPAVTIDAHSIAIDSRRIWIVSGTLHWSRIPSDDWPRRLRTAKLAGLNTIELPVIWALHEPRPGQFNFDGDLDLPAFLALASAEGLRTIVRAGPFVGAAHAIGGIPHWVKDATQGPLRSHDPEFLSAAARWLTKLAQTVRELQITRSAAGPILAVQHEHEWFCSDGDAARAYLDQIARYLREGGIDVPLINRNNLYEGAEGDLNAWTGDADLFAVTRQLRTVQRDKPPLIAGLTTNTHNAFGSPTGQHDNDPARLLRAAANVLAAGGQFNLDPFDAAAIPAFQTGMLTKPNARFVTPQTDSGAILDDAGAPAKALPTLRLLATFASSFERVLAAQDHAAQHATLEPPGDHPPPHPTAIHARGSQGSIVWIFWPDDKRSKAGDHATIILPDGSPLAVPRPALPVSWIATNIHLHARNTLDYTTLPLLTTIGSTLVCFGPPNAQGQLSINNETFAVSVPDGKAPSVQRHDDVTVVTLNLAQALATIADDDALYIGAQHVDDQQRVTPAKGFPKPLRIARDGRQAHADLAPARRTRLTLAPWSKAQDRQHVTGDHPRYARITRPEPLETLGITDGYAWLKLTIKSGADRKPKAAFFQAEDRLHLFANGSPVTIVGVGPGAHDAPVTIPLKRGDQTLTMLVDTLGRPADGEHLGRPAGLFGPIYETEPIKASPCTLKVGAPIEPLDFHSPIFGLHAGDKTAGQRLTWTFTHRKKTPVLIALDATPATDHAQAAVVLLNDQPVALPGPGGRTRLVVNAEQLKRGVNTIQLAIVGDPKAALANVRAAHLSVYEGVKDLTAAGELSLARWEPPPDRDFTPVPKASLKAATKPDKHSPGPAWWRTTINIAPAVPNALRVELAGLSKGQLLVNDHNIGRYFVATAAGEDVPPQSSLAIPGARLRAGDNTITIFDEHGFTPAKLKLTAIN